MSITHTETYGKFNCATWCYAMMLLAVPLSLSAQSVGNIGCVDTSALTDDEITTREGVAASLAVASDHGWLELTCLRAGMSRRRMIARPGWGMALGDSWRSGALRAAQQAIAHAESDSLARVLFLQLAMDSSAAPLGVSPSLLAEASEMAFDLVSAHAVTDPTTLRACTGFAVIARDIATARYCATRALALGVDSTWQALHLGWLEGGWGTEAAAGHFLRIAVQAAHGDSALAQLAAAIPGCIRLRRLARDRWVAEGTYRDSVVYTAIGLSPQAESREFDRAAAAQFLAIIPKGMGYSRCIRMTTMNSCQQFEPILRKLRVFGQVVRGWDVDQGRWVNVIAFGVPIADLPNADRQHRMAIRIRAADGLHLHQREWFTTYSGFGDTPDGGVMVRSEIIAFDQPLGAWTLDVGVDDWSVDGRRHGVIDDSSSLDGLEASSLILGSEQQGLSWKTGSDSVPLLPLGAISRDADARLTIQLLNHDSARTASVRITLERFGVGRTTVAPLLSISSPQQLPSGYSILERELDLSRIEKQRYTVTVTIEFEGGEVVQRSALLDLR